MGVTLHYRGILDDLGRLSGLCDELVDIAKAMEWSTTIFDDDLDTSADARLEYTPDGAHINGHLGLKGIALTPSADCETLWFTFDREGNLRSPMGMALLLDGTLKAEETWVFTKTQFSSPELHIWIVGLLKYLKKHYISNLKIHDEGGYWDTGAAVELRRRMNLINCKIAGMAETLSSPQFANLSGKSIEDVVAALEQLAREFHRREEFKNPPDESDGE